MMDRQTKGFTAAVVLAFAVLLQGCGYQPLYATRADGNSVSQDLASVSVQHQSTRVGQLVRNEILKSTRPAGTSAPDRYVLKFEAKSNARALVDTSDTVHRRLAYNLTAKFHLVDSSTQQTVFSGQAFSRVPYDRLNASFSNVQARVNAEEQAAQQVGQEMKTRLAAFLARN
jgi:LPS-assembly lipoprotein